jgi:regulator of replication initiation timing
MTPHQVFNLVADLETDLADFYQEIGRIENLKPYADIFSFMTDHSQNHARRIESVAASIDLPVLNTDPINELHRRLKSSLLEQIRDEKDVDTVMHRLARTEETIGQLYQSIADHYRRLAVAYTAVADQFETLSGEEFGHRDYILNEK